MYPTEKLLTSMTASILGTDYQQPQPRRCLWSTNLSMYMALNQTVVKINLQSARMEWHRLFKTDVLSYFAARTYVVPLPPLKRLECYFFKTVKS